MDPAVPLTLSPTLIVSRVKEALTCGLIAIVVSTGCVLLDLIFLIESVSNHVRVQRVWNHNPASVYILSE